MVLNRETVCLVPGRPLLWLIATLSGLHSPFVSAQEQQHNPQALSLGGYFGTGDFGEPEHTDIAYWPLAYEANAGPWGFQVVVPHLRVTGFGNVLVNVGGVTRAVAGESIETKQGLGDVVTSLLYRVDPWSARAPFVDLRLDLKIPTADAEKGLGTGEMDVSAQVDLSQGFQGGLVFATLGYTWRGDSELYVGLADNAFAQLGLAFSLRDSLNVGVYYDYRQAVSDFSVESHELVPYANWQLSDRWSFTLLTSWGMSDASADRAVLGQLRFTW